MTKCGKGWVLNCAHSRPCPSEKKGQMVVRNGVKSYEVTADKTYADEFKKLHGKAASPGSPNNADVIKVTLHCNENKCPVTLDGKAAEVIKNKQHYWLVDHEKMTLRHKDPTRKALKFLSTLKDAFTFHNDPDLKPESHTLNIDGEDININVYPGDYYTLLFNFPAVTGIKYSRGPNVKEEIHAKDDTGKAIEKGVQKGSDRAKPTALTTKPGNKPMGGGVKNRLSEFFNFGPSKESVSVLGMTFDAKTLTVEEDKSGPITKLLKDAPVVLLHNGKPVRLSALESVFAAIKMIQHVLYLLSQMAESTPKVGWYFDMSASFLTGSMAVQWGFAEAENDFSVERYTAVGMDMNLVAFSVELGFGIKSRWAEAVLFLKLSANGAMKSASKTPPSSDVRNTGQLTVIVDATPSTGGRVKAGKIASIEAMAKITFKMTTTFNQYFSNQNDHLIENKLEMSPVTLTAKMNWGKYSILNFEKKATKAKTTTIKLPSTANPEDRDRDLGEAGFAKRLEHYIGKARNGDLDVKLRVYYDGLLWRKAFDDSLIASNLNRAMKSILGGDYDLLDFTDRCAEGIVRDLAKMCGARRFSDDGGDILLVDFRDIICLSNAGSIGNMPREIELERPRCHVNPNSTIPAPRDMNREAEIRMSELRPKESAQEQQARYRKYMMQAAAYRRHYGETNKAQFLNMLVNYRSPCKIYEKQLNAGDTKGTIPPELKKSGAGKA